MKTKRRFPDQIVNAVRENKIIGIRAGTQPHRIIGIWAVVVQGRVFVRSWSIKQDGWYHAFLNQPKGLLQIAGRQLKIRAVRTRSERLRDAVDGAYMEKYNSPGSIRFARDLGRRKSRDTTTELVPL